MTKQKNETKIVSWFIIKKALIKFEDKEDSMSVSDNVMSASDFTKYPIKKGDSVEVGIINDEVTFLRKSKIVKKVVEQESKNVEQKKETKQVTIFAVAGNKKVVKFEKDGQWIIVSEDVQQKDYDEIGLLAGNLVTVTLVNNEISDVKQEEVKEKITSYTKPKVKSSSYRDETAMDKRTAIMCAKDVIVALVASKKLNDKVDIKSAINSLTKTFYNVLEEL